MFGMETGSSREDMAAKSDEHRNGEAPQTTKEPGDARETHDPCSTSTPRHQDNLFFPRGFHVLKTKHDTKQTTLHIPANRSLLAPSSGACRQDLHPFHDNIDCTQREEVSYAPSHRSRNAPLESGNHAPPYPPVLPGRLAWRFKDVAFLRSSTTSMALTHLHRGTPP